jgi:hypothetical protein
MRRVPRWPRRNLLLLTVFAPVLVATGLLGLTAPAASGPMSNAVPYDVFHIAFGLAGIAVVISRSHGAAALFNLGFGLVDLYQLAAGLTRSFPADLFALRPADHVLHLFIGALLVACGALGLAQRHSATAERG